MMNKKKTLCSILALSLASAMMAPSAYALSWKDGASVNYYFTYEGNNGGIASVTASDTNGTFSGSVAEGQTITTKTGTIVWKDSYTNTTTFTVDVLPGYTLSKLTGNVGEAHFETVDADTYTFQFTDEGAEAWCYGDDVSFTLLTEKIPYTVDFYADGKLVNHTKTTVNDPLDLSVVPEKEGYNFLGWYWNDEKAGDTLTEDMIASATENTIKLEALYEAKNYNVRIQYYEDNIRGELTSTLDCVVSYGKLPEVGNSHKVVGGELLPVTGDTTINMVRYTPVNEKYWGYDYGFFYNSKDEGIESVEYSIDNQEWISIDMNEGVKFSTTRTLFKDKTICFRVKVADGKELVFNDSNGSTNATRNPDGTYTFVYTRTAHQGYLDSNVPNISFDLSTVDAK